MVIAMEAIQKAKSCSEACNGALMKARKAQNGSANSMEYKNWQKRSLEY